MTPEQAMDRLFALIAPPHREAALAIIATLNDTVRRETTDRAKAICIDEITKMAAFHREQMDKLQASGAALFKEAGDIFAAGAVKREDAARREGWEAGAEAMRERIATDQLERTLTGWTALAEVDPSVKEERSGYGSAYGHGVGDAHREAAKTRAHPIPPFPGDPT